MAQNPVGVTARRGTDRTTRRALGRARRRTQLRRACRRGAERSVLLRLVGAAEYLGSRRGHPCRSCVGHQHGFDEQRGRRRRHRRRLHAPGSCREHVVGAGGFFGDSRQRVVVEVDFVSSWKPRNQRHHLDVRSDGRHVPRHACRRHPRCGRKQQRRRQRIGRRASWA
jgi:hypothetical protein